MKTAMQELKERLFDVKIRQNPITYDEMNGFIEKEKQQIIDAYDDGKYLTSGLNYNGETYFNKTFNTK
jgi:hypothetical protein